MKTWAYRQDQLPSTHPIMAEIRDLDDVLVNFDGITYAKGASVLKQLVAYVGMDEFFQGVQAYFKAHAFGNTRLSDLLGALEETSGRDLKTWSKAWLETAGINILRPEIDAGRGRASSRPSPSARRLRRCPPARRASPTLRPHRIAIGFYDLDEAGKLVRTEPDRAGRGRRAAPRCRCPAGTPAPGGVLLNDDDLSYAKVRLDEESLRVVTEHLGRLHRVAAARAVLGVGLGHDPRRRTGHARLPGAGPVGHRQGVRHRCRAVAAPPGEAGASTCTRRPSGATRA